ncbi:MAG TPA: arsenate reductase (glutaredoxin) [Burkholderiales bacterium]|jgi:arsenate reductase|nr:arsenate reductase (glutaredoxin) [Burkholderiales bacterium]
MAATVTIYHNPRCSKSRETLALIEGRGVEAQVIEYLKTPPTKEQLRALLGKLGMKPGALVRKGEPVYKEAFAGRTLTDEQWLDALAKHPILIERPIVVKGAKAVLGRPPENVLALLR